MAKQLIKRMAFLSFDWDYEIVSEYYRGMQAYVQGRDDVQLTIFSGFGHYYESYEPEEGSFEVFNLCNPKDYDGFLLQGNRTWPPAMRQKFADMAREMGKPVVSVNYALEGAHYVGTDNYEAMYGLVQKVLSDRGCTSCAFVNGLATSAEAQTRAQAWRDACADVGISDTRFYQANWQMEEGVAAARKMLGEPDLPQVIFCCNDDLAVGVQETLQEAGARVPEDVMVAGFDNREISLRTTPRITTIDRDYFSIAAKAAETLVRLIDGEELPAFVASEVRYVLSESCGYYMDTRESIIGDLYDLDNSLKHFYEILSHFQGTVLSADDLGSILSNCEQYAHEIHCPNVYLVMNDKYMTLDSERASVPYGTVSHLMAHSGSVRLGDYDDSHVYASYLTERLLPPEVPEDRPVYVVYPLRHNAASIGMLITEGLSPIMRHGFLTFFITLLAGSIDNVRKKEMLQAANSRLDNLYVHDELTGLFNRFGLDRFGTIAYDHLLRDFAEAQFIFVDVDNMKGINDTCGHEVGDQALRETAAIIRRAIRNENAFAMRYGGDEFLLICRRDLTARLEQELAMLRSSSKAPYRLELSIGIFHVAAGDGYTLSEAIQMADKRMYEDKKSHKARNGLAPA